MAPLKVTFKIRHCAFCAKAYKPVTPTQKCCSLECRFKSIAKPFEALEGCWEWPLSRRRGGYGQLSVLGHSPITAPRLSYQIFRGSIPANLCVCHSCDNPGCFNPAHLFLGTHADNVKDMWGKGRQPDPADNGSLKLTPEIVFAIKAAVGPQKLIAKRFGISQANVSMIRAGKTWKRLSVPH